MSRGFIRSGRTLHKHTGTARCHHQRFALPESLVRELLRRNLRLNDWIPPWIVRWFGFLGRNKFQPRNRPDHDGARQRKLCNAELTGCWNAILTMDMLAKKIQKCAHRLHQPAP
ncbi:hypothetical protein BH11PSE7_BH11PSE7_05070 [soil metagenome]